MHFPSHLWDSCKLNVHRVPPLCVNETLMGKCFTHKDVLFFFPVWVNYSFTVIVIPHPARPDTSVWVRTSHFHGCCSHKEEQPHPQRSSGEQRPRRLLSSSWSSWSVGEPGWRRLERCAPKLNPLVMWQPVFTVSRWKMKVSTGGMDTEHYNIWTPPQHRLCIM